MTPEEIQGVILFYIGLSAVGLALEVGRAVIWVGIFMWFYRRLLNEK